MNKNDLKTGMVVKIRNVKFMVINDYLVGNDGWLSLNKYGIDLKSLDGDEFYDIIKVYNVKALIGFKHSFDDCNLELIWERKPKLTKAEKTILRNMSEEYKYIARDKSGALYIYNNKPYKNIDTNMYCVNKGIYNKFDMYNYLFQMIQWSDEEPTLVGDLLEEK